MGPRVAIRRGWDHLILATIRHAEDPVLDIRGQDATEVVGVLRAKRGERVGEGRHRASRSSRLHDDNNRVY